MLTSPGLPSPMWLAERVKYGYARISRLSLSFSASPLLCRTPIVIPGTMHVVYP